MKIEQNTKKKLFFNVICRENIMYGIDEGTIVSEEDFQRVIEEAHVAEFARNLPDGTWMNKKIQTSTYFSCDFRSQHACRSARHDAFWWSEAKSGNRAGAYQKPQDSNS